MMEAGFSLMQMAKTSAKLALLSEKKIIRGCQRGKKKSQYALVERYSGMLMTVCRRYVSDEATAKDLLQETYIRIFTHIRNYQPTGSFEAWMRTIAIRCALQWLRQKYVQQEFTAEETISEEMSEPEVYGNLMMEEMIALIQELPPGFRAVFNLSVIEGYSHQEISEMLEIQESTSRSQLLRARRILQEKINSIYAKNLGSI